MIRQEFLILLFDQPNVEPVTKLLNVLLILVLTKIVLALQCGLSHHRSFKQASACSYFWKDNKIIHATLEILNNKNEILKLAKVKVNSVNRGRINNNNNNFVTTSIVSIVAG